MSRKLPAELLGRPSPEETSAKGRNAAQPPHFADLGSSTFRRDLVLQAARRTAPAVALVPGTLFVPTDISAPAFGAATRPVACRPSIRLRRVPAGRRLLQRTERSTDRRDFAHARRYEHLLNAALVDPRVGRVRPPLAELSGFEPGRVGAKSGPPADCCWKGVNTKRFWKLGGHLRSFFRRAHQRMNRASRFSCSDKATSQTRRAQELRRSSS